MSRRERRVGRGRSGEGERTSRPSRLFLKVGAYATGYRASLEGVNGDKDIRCPSLRYSLHSYVIRVSSLSPADCDTGCRLKIR